MAIVKDLTVLVEAWCEYVQDLRSGGVLETAENLAEQERGIIRFLSWLRLRGYQVLEPSPESKTIEKGPLVPTFVVTVSQIHENIDTEFIVAVDAGNALVSFQDGVNAVFSFLDGYAKEFYVKGVTEGPDVRVMYLSKDRGS